MADAKGQTVSLRITGTSSSGEAAEFGASGTVITFRGFLAAYEESRDETGNGGGDASDDDSGGCRTSQRATPSRWSSSSRRATTNPPARYTEATLVRTMEELGIGRPSTYASILGTILDRGYVFKKGTALVPSFLAFAVVRSARAAFRPAHRLRLHRRMEDDLDSIAAGDQQRVESLRRFYFGDHDDGLQQLVSDLGAIDAREINSIEIGEGIVLRVGRYGPYLERDGQRANVPEDVVPDELTVARATELLDQPSGDRPLGADPETGREIVARTGRYGPYVTEVLPEESKEKPRTASIFKSMSPDTVTLGFSPLVRPASWPWLIVSRVIDFVRQVRGYDCRLFCAAIRSRRISNQREPRCEREPRQEPPSALAQQRGIDARNDRPFVSDPRVRLR